MNKVFIDSDVILDFLLDRQPFIDEITFIIEKAIGKEIQLCVASHSVTNLYYIIRRLENKKKAKTKTINILKLVKVKNVGQSTIDKAIHSTFKDFEDAVQNFCAIESNHKIIITRNVKDFKESRLAILTQKEFLVKIG